MFSFAFIYIFINISVYLLFGSSIANPSVDDNMLIAFIKGHKEIQISDFSVQKYEAHLGVLYLMRTNWKCDKIHEKFDAYERTKCQKYRKYLDILYEYLCREYTGIHTVKPKFVFKKLFEINGPIIHAVNCLVTISQFYFCRGPRYKNKFKDLLKWHNIFEPKLLNEDRLDYELKLVNEQKLPINEMILQLAIDTAKECQTKESLDGIIRQKFDKIFEKKLGEIFKRAEEIARKDGLRTYEINNDKHCIIKDSKFDDSLKWVDNYLFTEFFKGQTTNVAKFSNYNVESHLCNLYSLRKKFRRCDANCEFKTYCNKGRKNSRILYEYLFRLYADAKSPSESRQLPPVKPIFFYVDSSNHYGNPLSLIDVVENLIYAANRSCNTVGLLYGYSAKLKGMDLVNEVELNYYENGEEENRPTISKFMAKITGRKNLKNGKEILNESTRLKTIRKEFEQKMKNMCEGESKKLEKHFYN